MSSLNKETGHDGFAGAGIVGQQETKRLARKHRIMNRSDLVRQRLDQRSMHGQNGIK